MTEDIKPATPLPLGAIHNGQEHFRRLVDFYEFNCIAGPLINCVDFKCAEQCFNHLANEITTLKAENDRLREALEKIIERSENEQLGTGKVVDMKKIACTALQHVVGK